MIKYLVFTLSLMIASFAFNQKNPKFKPGKGIVKLNVLSGEQKIKVGQKFYYSGHTHGSVGETYSLSCSSSGFKKVDSHFTYDNIKKSEMSGGDGGTKTVVYEALKPGTYNVTISNMFRGDVLSTSEIKITVLEK